EYGVPPLGGGKRQVSWLPQPPLTNRLKAGLRAGVREAGPIWAVLFASGAAALLNPNGVLLYTVPLKVMGVRLFEQSVFEWNPPAFEYDFWPYYIYLAMLAAAFAARPRAAGAADWIAALGFGWMSLTSRRHIPLLVYSTAPVLAQLLRDWRAEVGKTGIGPLVWEKRRPARLSGRGSQTPPAAIDRESAPVSRFPAPRSLEFLRRRIPLPYLRELVVAALILAGAHWTYRMLAFKYIPWGLGVYSLAQPRKAVDFIERAGLKPNLFNGYNWGGYVAWRLFPAWKTFIDGRVDLYGPERVKEYYSWITGTGDWRGAFERFGIQTVLLDYQQARGKLGRQLWQSPEWALVYWDDIGVVYARPSPETQAAVEAHAFHAFNPAWSYAEAVDALPAGPKRETALAELKEQLAHDPRSIRALDFESYFDSIDGRLDEAAELCRRMIALQPRGATAYARLATILDKQRDLDGAERAYRMTLRLQPRMADAWVRLGAMYERRGDSKTALRYYQRALQVRPGDLDGLYNAARVSANLGRDRESLRLWERYLSVKPGEPDLLQGVADLYRQIGDEVDAWRLLSSTSSTSPTSSTLSASTPGFSLRSGALSPTISKTKETASFRA
ncbi:MAG: tetratricopeptide repeat protein, partial [Candidatus Sumerlaeota bacterium]|nr:tetratricopeptide repeat protein [Candidatus Sumerlaeota bacterium]